MSRARQAFIGALLLLAGFAIALKRTPRGSAAPNSKLASAIFAGGCFWCTEADFDKIPGVVSTVSGYSGGKVANPTYEQVSAGGTGHIEAVRVVYDPARVSYQTLVARFFRTVDPLDSGGQFCDRGYQYRTAIFVAGPAERRVAEATRARASPCSGSPSPHHPPRRPLLPAEGYTRLLPQEPAKYKYTLALRPRSPPTRCGASGRPLTQRPRLG